MLNIKFINCYRTVDFNGLQETLRTLPWDLVTSDTSIDTTQRNSRICLIFCAIDQHILQRTLKQCSGPPYIDNKTMKLIRKKKRLWKSLKTNGSADLFLKFKDFRRKTKKLINSRYQQYLQSLSGKLQENPKHFWAFSILSNLRQNEFLKLLFMDTLGLGT